VNILAESPYGFMLATFASPPGWRPFPASACALLSSRSVFPALPLCLAVPVPASSVRSVAPPLRREVLLIEITSPPPASLGFGFRLSFSAREATELLAFPMKICVPSQDTPKATAGMPPQRTPSVLRPHRATTQRAGDNPTDAPGPHLIGL